MPKEARSRHQHRYAERQEDGCCPRGDVVGADREGGIHPEGFYRLDTKQEEHPHAIQKQTRHG